MKVFELMKKLYGITMFISFFAASIPVIPFIIALIIGGETGEAIATFLSGTFYPIVMIIACVSVLFGVVAMYASKRHDFSLKTLGKSEEEK